jgi:hypothetical protein
VLGGVPVGARFSGAVVGGVGRGATTGVEVGALVKGVGAGATDGF